MFASLAGSSIIINGRDERREVAIPERGPRVLPRAEHFVASGTVTGTAADTVYTSGLATCPGLAASGSPGAGGIDKGKGIPCHHDYLHQVRWLTYVTSFGTHLMCACGWDYFPATDEPMGQYGPQFRDG